MNFLSLLNIGKTFGSKPLFEGLSLHISEKEHIGLVGPNGAGKSTLLKIMAGMLEVDEGQYVSKKHLKKAYCPQDPVFEKNKSVVEVLAATAKSSGITADEAELNAQILLSQHGFEDPDEQVDTLSGGRQKRLSILQALIQEPDLLLLDEPSNHLDVASLHWLEKTLQETKVAWVMVSHDRSLLNRTVHFIIEINSIYETCVHKYSGNYSSFLVAKQKYIEEMQQQIDSLGSKVRIEEAWLRQGAKARSTKSKYRTEEAYAIQNQLSELKKRSRTQSAHIGFQSSGRGTKKLMSLTDVGLERGGKRLFKDLTFDFMAGERIGILGSNGIGKSSFLHLLTGKLNPTEGKVKKVDQLKLIYFSQERKELDLKMSLKEALSPLGDSVIYLGRTIHINAWAQLLSFSKDMLQTPLGKLSGGEKARVLIGQLMLKEADVLILDEPTNDLDIQTLEILEESLKSFGGTVVLVSHDRYFLTEVCKRYIGFNQQKLITYASVEQWEGSLKQDSKEKKSRPSVAKTAPVVRKKQASYKEKREFEQMEAKILELESKLTSISTLLENENLDVAKQNELYNELQLVQSNLENAYKRWSELEALCT